MGRGRRYLPQCGLIGVVLARPDLGRLQLQPGGIDKSQRREGRRHLVAPLQSVFERLDVAFIFLPIADLHLAHESHAPRKGRIGTEFESGVVARGGVGLPAHVCQQGRTIDVNVAHIRVVFQRGVVGFERVLMPSHAVQAKAEIIEGRDIVGLEPDHTLEAVRRTWLIAQPEEYGAAIKVRAGEIGIEANGLVISLERFIVALKGEQDSSAVINRIGRVHTKRNGALVVRERFGQALKRGVRDAAIVNDGG